MRMIVAALSGFGLLCACWLATMEALLRHPGYPGRIGLAIGIGAISAATILVLMLHVEFRQERWLWAGAAALIVIGVQAFMHNARAAHFEGFVFLISLAIIAQGLLMLVSLGRRGHKLG